MTRRRRRRCRTNWPQACRTPIWKSSRAVPMCRNCSRPGCFSMSSLTSCRRPTPQLSEKLRSPKFSCRQFGQRASAYRSTLASSVLGLVDAEVMLMRAVLDYCTGATRREVPMGTLVLQEGSKTGHLFVLLEGRLEVIKGDSVVAVLTEPGAMLGEMSVLLD